MSRAANLTSVPCCLAAFGLELDATADANERLRLEATSRVFDQKCARNSDEPPSLELLLNS
jgi:hypothetical protein